MALLSASGLAVTFGERTLFSGVSFDVGPKDKIGLIGVNGAGKTTLFRLLTKQLSPAMGALFFGKETVPGYMEQHACAESEKTMFDEMLTVYSDVIEAERELDLIARRLEHGTGDEDLLHRQQTLLELYTRRDGATYRSRARSALLGLGFLESDFSLPCALLSGGQRSKLSLAKLLLSGANLLLLDEPTNHLDIPSIGWLEGFIADFSGAVIVISHDRYFLDKVTSRTFELEHGKLYTANGNYTRYMELKAERKKAEERVYAASMKEIHRIEGIIEQQKRFNRERNYKTIASKQKSIDRIEKDLVIPEKELQSIRFRFETASQSGNDVLLCTGLSKSFGDKTLFQNADLFLQRGERVFLTGENGCGKSTLLKMILGKATRDCGKVNLGVGVKIGYFDQTLAELSSDKTVLDEVWDNYKRLNEVDVRRALAAFLFKGEDVFKNMKALSGGEKARVALLKLMLSGANFLVLDEPTNHLDIHSREALESAFDTFDGTMLVVSHDRYFINRLATRVVRLTESGIESFDGNYDTFYAAMEAKKAAAQPQKKEPKQNDYQKRKERDSRLRRLKGQISRLEAQIDALDETAASLQAQLSDPSNAAAYETILSLTEQLHETTTQQEALMEEWQSLSEALTEMEELA
ncbi:MAG: ABC-F family ATP-binding cassette domain-containing protein [Clostridia bacterium]|nr:ABC-F family ATP-binding cassette domain-containing protein [Clostridia bacterium]